MPTRSGLDYTQVNPTHFVCDYCYSLGLVTPLANEPTRCLLDEMVSNDTTLLGDAAVACFWRVCCFVGMTKADYAVADMSLFKPQLPPGAAILTPATEEEIIGSRRVQSIRARALMDTDPARFFKEGAETRAMKRARE